MHARRAEELIDANASTAELREKAIQALREMLVVKRQFAEALYRHCLDAN
jgi:hypothetical protein